MDFASLKQKVIERQKQDKIKKQEEEKSESQRIKNRNSQVIETVKAKIAKLDCWLLNPCCQFSNILQRGDLWVCSYLIEVFIQIIPL